MFIECMHEQEDGKLTCSLLDGFAMRFNTDIDMLNQFYNDAITIGLFATDGEKYWSERVLRNKKSLAEKRVKKSQAGKKGMQSRWHNQAVSKQCNNTVIAKHNKGKESKVNKSKVNSIPPYIPPAGEKPKSKKDEPKKEKYGEFENVLLTVDEYQKLCERLGNQVQAYIDRLDGYIASKGVKYKSHYATILNWWRKDSGRGNPPDKKKTSSSFFDLIGEVDDG